VTDVPCLKYASSKGLVESASVYTMAMVVLVRLFATDHSARVMKAHSSMTPITGV
jgi:hypothetical protein